MLAISGCPARRKLRRLNPQHRKCGSCIACDTNLAVNAVGVRFLRFLPLNPQELTQIRNLSTAAYDPKETKRPGPDSPLSGLNGRHFLLSKFGICSHGPTHDRKQPCHVRVEDSSSNSAVASFRLFVSFRLAMSMPSLIRLHTEALTTQLPMSPE